MSGRPNNIVELFLKSAEKFPDHIAIIEGDRKISYCNLQKEVAQTAAYFRSKGIGVGDRVLVFVPMGIDLYRIVLALFYIGATAVFLDEWVSKERMEQCAKLANCKGFIGILKARALALFSKELRRIPVKLKLTQKLNEKAAVAEVQPETSALITFTTGSTGTPKAANRTHEFLRVQFDALLEEIEPKPIDVDMTTLPIVLFVNLGVGCTSVIAKFKMTKPDRMKPAIISEQIRKHKVNRITASPFFIRRLAEYCIEQKTEFNRLEKLFTGGAPVFPFEGNIYLKAFSKAKIIIVYGSTEAEPISSITANALVKRKDELQDGLPVGSPFYKTAVKIIKIIDAPISVKDENEFTNLWLKDGEIGEIIVAGDHVLKQYFNNEDAFRQNKIVMGKTIWHRTGDSGFMRGGELFLTGRCKQLIETKTGWLSPFIIENQLQEIPGVTMGTLIKIKEHLVLALETKLKIDQLKGALKNIPFDAIQIVSKIPRDPRHNSKIDYEKLRKSLYN